MPLSSQFLPMFLFALAGALTPGPNNMISAGSGAAFGFRRTLPQIWGVTVGFAIMVVAIGMGLGTLFLAIPYMHQTLKIVGSLYLLYLAWKIANAGGPGGGTTVEKPMTLLQSALFQWVNPKAWTIALSIVPAFTTVGGDDLFAEVAMIALVSGLVTFPSLCLWAGFGALLARLLSTPRQQRLVNYAMAALVALSVFMLFL
ncbi:threonine/homoserine/homoserine lactone efflux protein [Ancylobacter aquaticus]|uniref:Threonine/homoserine/homoserine lactone efflux protein n=1 Tax=Ancylobacter aquaticus TaxID=100 RepID=A0A4R1I0G6_ANCAQ|nr:LysE family translocator [Ancylobacter aquaticus]TCK28637.1 threonine/homoserine/homoserine lactone efflux protein [Ancylobacter aquaticus]